MKTKERKLAHKDHEKRGYVQGVISPPENYIDKGETKEEHVKYYSHYPLETLWIFTSHKKVKKRDHPKFHAHEE